MSDLRKAMERAALAGALEISEFLENPGSDPERLKRVHVAVGAVSGFTRWSASQNNMVSTVLMAARQTGATVEATRQILGAAGLTIEVTKADGSSEDMPAVRN